MSEIAKRAKQASRPVDTGDAETADPAVPEIRAALERMGPALQRAVPEGMSGDQLVRDALTLMQENPKLTECDTFTFLGAIMSCAQLGLRPGPFDQVAIVPFRRKGSPRPEAKLIIMYQGLTELMYRHPKVTGVVGQPVHARDAFTVAYGTSPKITHHPYIGPDDPGPVTAYYAAILLADGAPVTHVLRMSEFRALQDRYGSGYDGAPDPNSPWHTDPDAMGVKTCIRRAAKLAPRASVLGLAMRLDETVRSDVSVPTPADPQH